MFFLLVLLKKVGDNRVMTPSEKYNKPVIGTIVAQISGKITENGKTKTLKMPEDVFEVIDIVKSPYGNYYVCNLWNQPLVVQIVPDMFVINFTPKKG